MKVFIAYIVIPFLSVFGCISFLIDNMPSGKNEGKLGLIGNRDTCRIINESRNGWLRVGSKKTRVKYRDRNGIYHDEEFNATEIKIIE